MIQMCILLIYLAYYRSVISYISNLTLIVQLENSLFSFLSVYIHNHLLFLIYMSLELLIEMLVESLVKIELLELL